MKNDFNISVFPSLHFKVNNENIKTSVLWLYFWLWTDVTHCFDVFNVDLLVSLRFMLFCNANRPREIKERKVFWYRSEKILKISPTLLSYSKGNSLFLSEKLKLYWFRKDVVSCLTLNFWTKLRCLATPKSRGNT